MQCTVFLNFLLKNYLEWSPIVSIIFVAIVAIISMICNAVSQEKLLVAKFEQPSKTV